jgi:hypothetical protein
MRPQTEDNHAALPSHDRDGSDSTEAQGLSVGPLRIGSGGEIGGTCFVLVSESRV